ncbi:hypothetical protein [Streptomyces sp. NPDC101132]|uniref:hypothetical protein n=1 Tax=Streptomyces sp. NPDC101132 TaxID=3366110 RepID=UPI0037F9D882
MDDRRTDGTGGPDAAADAPARRHHHPRHQHWWWRPPDTHADYTGAVYGSVLAASVVVGGGTYGNFPRVNLALLVLLTAFVFWAAHVFAHVFGASLAARQRLSRREVLRVGAGERPVIDAALPPALALLVSPLLGMDEQGSVWLALGVAIAGQVGWATAGAVRAGAPRKLVALCALVNLLLGLVIVAAKAALTH